MSFFVESSGSREFKLVPPGNHLARLYRIVDLGTQERRYEADVKFQRQVMLGWEIHSEDEAGEPTVTEDGVPMAIFKNYTLSWNEAATLRKDLQAWRGKPWTDAEAKRFDLKNILGQWCLLNVVHKVGRQGDKTFANVAGIGPVPSFLKQKGLPAGHNELQLFRLGEPDWELYETFSKGLKAKIESSPEFQSLKRSGDAPEATKSKFDDIDQDIPF